MKDKIDYRQSSEYRPEYVAMWECPYFERSQSNMRSVHGKNYCMKNIPEGERWKKDKRCYYITCKYLKTLDAYKSNIAFREKLNRGGL